MIVGLLSIYVTQIMSVNLWIIHNTQTEFHMLCPYHCSRREQFGGEKKPNQKINIAEILLKLLTYSRFMYTFLFQCYSGKLGI